MDDYRDHKIMIKRYFVPYRYSVQIRRQNDLQVKE